MKIWVSNKHETLRAIAIKNRLSVEELFVLNPHIENPDLDITGKSVYLPSATETNNEIQSRADSIGSIPTCSVAPTETLNNWIPLTPISQMAEQEYDVLIIGTGAGGGSVLWRLCEQWKRQKKRIGIIERGNQVIPTHARNLSTMNQERLVAYFSSLSKPLPGALPEYPGARQLFALGGRTLFWYAFTPRMHEWDLAKWPIPVHEMESYYGIAEEVMNVTGAFAEGASFTEILLERSVDARLFQGGTSSGCG